MEQKQTTINLQASGQPAKVKSSTKDSVQIRGTHFAKDVNARAVFQNPVMSC